jgi:hypothetical protein
MDETHINAVADVLAAVGYDGIAAFGESGPEYGTLETLYEEFDDEAADRLATELTTAME